MLYRVKQIQGVSKQLLKLVPNSGQTSVGAGQKIIVSLPANSLVDLSTFEFNFTGQTQHNGNASASYNTNYVQWLGIRQWLGILGGNASTNVIDTSIYGQVDIEITLAPAGVLMLGAAISTVTATALTAATSEIGVATTGGAGAGAVAVEGTSYTLSNISFSITRYDMPSSYYDAVRSVLQSGATYKFYYPNYSCFQHLNHHTGFIKYWK